jgi:hypothetical protein
VGFKGIDWACGPVREAGVNASRALLTELGLHPTIVNMPGPNVLTADDVAFVQGASQANWTTTRRLLRPPAARLDNIAPGEQARLGLESTTAVMKRAGVL